MTKQDYKILSEILAQIWWSEESLGEGVLANKKAIDELLKQNDQNYDSDKFWQNTTKEKLLNQTIIS